MEASMEHPGDDFEKWRDSQPHVYDFPKFEFNCRKLLWYLEDVAFFGLLEKLGKVMVLVSVVTLAFEIGK